MSTDHILTVVEHVLVDIAGDDLLLAGPITEATSFSADLELESIEFVALAEKLQQHYGASVDFVGWIATKELDAIITLTVGELIAFIASCTEDHT